MLKIKEDKMKKLKMLGFFEVKTDDGHIYVRHIYRNTYSNISLVIETDRSITINANCGEVWSDNLDIFYDLFERDMVEKDGE